MRGLVWWIFAGFVAGIAFGAIFGQSEIAGVKAIDILKPFGDIFLRLLQMLVVPLVFSTLIAGVVSIEPKRVARIGASTLVLYLITTAIAISIALSLALIIKPGMGMSLAYAEEATVSQPSMVDVLVGIVPKNIVDSMAKGDILPVILFAILFGIAISLVGEKADPVRQFFESFAEVMYKLVELVLYFAPIGVFALIAYNIGQQGMSILLPYGKLIGTEYLALAMHALIVYSVIVILSGKGLLSFWKAAKDPAIFAFASRSSSGTLPITMRAADELGIDRSIHSFTLPLGATINMDGTAIYCGVSAIFIAYAFGVEVTAPMIMIIVLTATLASIGTAGVPSGGLIMLVMVTSAAGLPIEGWGLIAGIDVIMDMGRSCINVVGDLSVTSLIDRFEK
ncbi:MAG: dicarboxylate/amino acid:cation symporter [Candidatus Thermoplasmatota archaeon]|nr:dicarboxylate/amino acid:cation symporter [Candidatus Thermoplasmatota archaeon]